MEMLPLAMPRGMVKPTHSAPAILFAALSLCACGSQARRSPDTVYRRAEASVRSGDLPQALGLALAGFEAWRKQPATEWSWKFRLLAAEILDRKSVV